MQFDYPNLSVQAYAAFAAILVAFYFAGYFFQTKVLVNVPYCDRDQTLRSFYIGCFLVGTGLGALIRIYL